MAKKPTTASQPAAVKDEIQWPSAEAQNTYNIYRHLTEDCGLTQKAVKSEIRRRFYNTHSKKFGVSASHLQKVLDGHANVPRLALIPGKLLYYLHDTDAPCPCAAHFTASEQLLPEAIAPLELEKVEQELGPSMNGTHDDSATVTQVSTVTRTPLPDIEPLDGFVPPKRLAVARAFFTSKMFVLGILAGSCVSILFGFIGFLLGWLLLNHILWGVGIAVGVPVVLVPSFVGVFSIFFKRKVSKGLILDNDDRTSRFEPITVEDTTPARARVTINGEGGVAAIWQEGNWYPFDVRLLRRNRVNMGWKTETTEDEREAKCRKIDSDVAHGSLSPTETKQSAIVYSAEDIRVMRAASENNDQEEVNPYFRPIMTTAIGVLALIIFFFGPSVRDGFRVTEPVTTPTTQPVTEPVTTDDTGVALPYIVEDDRRL